MECRSCSNALTALMDGELSGREESEVRSHLSSCNRCKEEHDSLQVAYQLTSRLQEVSNAEELWPGVRAELEPSAPQPRAGFFDFLRRLVSRPWVPATGLAGFLLLALIFTVWPSGQEPLESQFLTFIEQREQISIENRDLLFGEGANERYQPRRNPFVKPIRLQENPFEE